MALLRAQVKHALDLRVTDKGGEPRWGVSQGLAAAAGRSRLFHAGAAGFLLGSNVHAHILQQHQEEIKVHKHLGPASLAVNYKLRVCRRLEHRGD